ncbi:hypothetical protein MIMGU_mgv1a014962mg [Erythranthe guttata]|uniref:Uncharacterized protein n=1 Tax=Erythranthe guttata TaxID=4155 RepID=A0A022R741_ERYGU|nr:hypothetical protein MIMGU_mgv1a014962mg [Erythranthe guttata]
MGDSEYTYGVGARNCDEQEETSNLVVATESKPAEWTDEKHSLYLKSMEATFVNQLYKSLNLLSGSKSSKQNTASGGPSSQFKVLRDGCWSKIEFKGDREEVNQEEEGVLFANPWIQHYRSSSEKQPIRKVRAKDSSATTLNQKSARNFNLWNRNSSKKGSILIEIYVHSLCT